MTTTKKTPAAKKSTTKATAEKKAPAAKKTTTKKAATKSAVAVAEPVAEIVAPAVKEKLVATMMPETPQAEISMEAVVAKSAPQAEVKASPVAERTIVLTIGMFQKRLSELGLYDGPWDGVYGPLTKHAAARFQAANGLAVNGDANAETLKALGLDLYTTY